MISITYSECLPVALVIQHAQRVRRIVICGVFGSTKFFHIKKDPIFEKKTYIENKIPLLILSKTSV